MSAAGIPENSRLSAPRCASAARATNNRELSLSLRFRSSSMSVPSA